MEIQVLLFASIKEAAGTASLQLSLPEGARASSVLDELMRRLPDRRVLLDRSALAVNEAYADGDVMLREGDIVAVIPPVSGGEDLCRERR